MVLSVSVVYIYSVLSAGYTELSENQLSQLVALVRSPSIYVLGSDKGERRASEILEKAKSQMPMLSK
jgi:membrane peptidoglycan carboxypeptidase